jgi:hypothetical protein
MGQTVQHPKLRSVVRAVPLVAVLALVAASCGSGNPVSAHATQESKATSPSSTFPPITVPPTTPAPSGPSWTITTTQSSGYTATISVQAGPVETYQMASASAHKPMCGDPATGGFIPMHVTLTNTTGSFPASVLFTGQLGTSVTSVNVGADLPGGSSPCGNAGINGGVTLVYNDVAARQSVSDNFYVVLSPYYSPSAPSGNQAAYAGATLELLYVGAGPSQTAAASTATIQGSAHTNSTGPVVISGSGTLFLSGQCPPTEPQNDCTT